MGTVMMLNLEMRVSQHYGPFTWLVLAGRSGLIIIAESSSQHWQIGASNLGAR